MGMKRDAYRFQRVTEHNFFLMLNNTAILLGLVFSVAIAAYAEPISINPTLPSDVLSSTGRYLLHNVWKGPNDDRELHLKEVSTGRTQLLMSYGRSISVLWSSDDTSLIVNDNLGSDHSEPVIFRFKGAGEWTRSDLNFGQLKQALGAQYKSISGNHHVYIVAMQWLSNTKLKIRITGHGDVDPEGFVIWCDYTVTSSSVSECSSSPR